MGTTNGVGDKALDYLQRVGDSTALEVAKGLGVSERTIFNAMLRLYGLKRVHINKRRWIRGRAQMIYAFGPGKDDLTIVGKEGWVPTKRRHYPTKEDWPRPSTIREDRRVQQAKINPATWIPL